MERQDGPNSLSLYYCFPLYTFTYTSPNLAPYFPCTGLCPLYIARKGIWRQGMGFNIDIYGEREYEPPIPRPHHPIPHFASSGAVWWAEHVQEWKDGGLRPGHRPPSSEGGYRAIARSMEPYFIYFFGALFSFD